MKQPVSPDQPSAREMYERVMARYPKVMAALRGVRGIA